MDHKTALNKILADACPGIAGKPDDPDYRLFVIETHCVVFKVEARLVSTVDTIQFDILDVTYADGE